MPKTDQSSTALLAAVQTMLRRLVDTSRVEGRQDALATITDQLLGSGGRRGRGAGRSGRAASAVSAKPHRKRKNPWATMSPTDRLARINAIRKGRGLPPREKL